MNTTNLEDFVRSWMISWNEHNLNDVLRVMADDVVFEDWTGRTIRGKRHLRLAWSTWFANHADFRFDVRSICVSDANDSLSFEWVLDWLPPNPDGGGQRETRAGIDYVRIRDGLVVAKNSYVKTTAKTNTTCGGFGQQ
jgi:ketosteroid isomerase-like protein